MSDHDFHWDAFTKFVSEFAEESDRAAVILGAAKLDALLCQILDRRLLPSLGANDELLDGDAPLATFSSRIAIFYRLGLITPDFAKALHQVRKIRNHFAHELSGCSLESGPQSDRLRALLLPLRQLPFYKRFKNHFFGETDTASTNFKAILALMIARLEARLVETSTIESNEAWRFIVGAWKDDALTKEDEGKDQ